jgi:hypothetical protein
MPDRSRKHSPKAVNKPAKNVIAIATQASENNDPSAKGEGKNPAAVALGRLGGLKGGQARAAKLSPKQRKSIAAKAAKARWSAARGEKGDGE